MSIGDYAIAILLLATFGVLLAGIVLMAVGGKVNKQYGNKLMVARVSLQGLVIVMIVLLFAVSKH